MTANTIIPFPDSSIIIQEGNYIVKNLLTEEEKIQAYRLRHKIFCEELKWLPLSGDGLEIDEYDSYSFFFGVFDKKNKINAFARLTLPVGLFMIEKVFPFLIGTGYKIRKEDDTVEISRLCVSQEVRNNLENFGYHEILMLLYKSIYYWCIIHNIRYIYLVVEQRFYRLCRIMGFPCKLIGEPVIMPDGLVAVAAIMDWREFESLNKVRRPKMIKWFTQYQSIVSQ
ncbi:MAG: hypothetical protein Fur0020_03190 [Thermodesulfovibrionia bacterium]